MFAGLIFPEITGPRVPHFLHLLREMGRGATDAFLVLNSPFASRTWKQIEPPAPTCLYRVIADR
jgi:hypothetical protein